MKQKGRFWPRVRTQIYEKAQQLFQEQQARTMSIDFKGVTATKKELREAGYVYTAKLIVLRNLWRQNKRTLTVEEETEDADR
jgi:hypothetical protein